MYVYVHMFYLSIESIRHSERTGNPTEGVHHMCGKTVYDAADRLAHILGGSDDKAAG